MKLLSTRSRIIAAVVFAFIGIGLIVFLVREPGIASDIADGSYAHDCCGTIVLRDGRMSANDVNWTSYVVEVDEAGPYILPDRYVGTADNGIVLDGSTPVRKLRLDTIPNPTMIALPHTRGLSIFVRTARRNRRR